MRLSEWGPALAAGMSLTLMEHTWLVNSALQWSSSYHSEWQPGYLSPFTTGEKHAPLVRRRQQMPQHRVPPHLDTASTQCSWWQLEIQTGRLTPDRCLPAGSLLGQTWVCSVKQLCLLYRVKRWVKKAYTSLQWVINYTTAWDSKGSVFINTASTTTFLLGLGTVSLGTQITKMFHLLISQ